MNILNRVNSEYGKTLKRVSIRQIQRAREFENSLKIKLSRGTGDWIKGYTEECQPRCSNCGRSGEAGNRVYCATPNLLKAIADLGVLDFKVWVKPAGWCPQYIRAK